MVHVCVRVSNGDALRACRAMNSGPSSHLCVSDDLLELVLVLALVHVLLRRQVRRNLIRHDQVYLIRECRDGAFSGLATGKRPVPESPVY